MKLIQDSETQLIKPKHKEDQHLFEHISGGLISITVRHYEDVVKDIFLLHHVSPTLELKKLPPHVEIRNPIKPWSPCHSDGCKHPSHDKGDK